MLGVTFMRKAPDVVAFYQEPPSPKKKKFCLWIS